MSRLFPNLFSPLDIKGVRFKNRLFFAAHGTGYAEDGGVGSAGYEYYRARVTRGPSLLVTEATQVVPLPGQKYAQLNASDDACIPQFRRIAELCHDNDCRYFVQLFHAGRAHYHSPDGTRPANYSASTIPDERHHGMPMAMAGP